MDYPLQRRYRELLLHPFAKPMRKVALGGVDISIKAGERVAFLGPNGAGKTSLLKLISGLLFPRRGSLTVGGHDTSRDNDAARASVSLVLNEERSFYWRLSGRENLEFFGALEGLRGRVLKRRIDEVLELVKLGEGAERSVGAYSSGMRQRLSLARGLLTDPQILILDEPSRALDPLAAAELVSFLVESLHRGLDKTLLVATHSLHEASLLCDRLCVLVAGNIKQDSSLEKAQRDFPSLMDFYVKAVGA